MNSNILTIPSLSERSQNVLLAMIAIGLGVTLPRIFHLFGLGPVFLPMFLPIVVLSPLVSPLYLLSISTITPLLSTTLFGMPQLSTSGVIICSIATVIIVVLVIGVCLKFGKPIPDTSENKHLIIGDLNGTVGSDANRFYTQNIVISLIEEQHNI